MHLSGPDLPEAERNALGKEFCRIIVDNPYSISIISLSPMAQGAVVKKKTLHDVPHMAANDCTFSPPCAGFL